MYFLNRCMGLYSKSCDKCGEFMGMTADEDDKKVLCENCRKALSGSDKKADKSNDTYFLDALYKKAGINKEI